MEYKYDVFISYSRKDTSVANQICNALDIAGITYFIDRQGIGGGMEFPEILANAILGSRLFLFLASNNSYESKFTNSEITFAFNEKAKESIIPYIIDGSVLPVNLRLVFSGINWRNKSEHPINSTLVHDILALLGRSKSYGNRQYEQDNNRDDIIIGQILCGKKKNIWSRSNTYYISKKIGEGKTGIVYLAHLVDNPMKRFAIKKYSFTDLRSYEILDTSEQSRVRGTNTEFYQIFTKAFKSSSMFHHNSIVKNVEMIELDQTPYWIMEYLDGNNLYDHIASSPLSEIEVVQIIKDILNGLNYMHGKGYLHCDIKPQNIMLCKNGIPKIIDFSTIKNFRKWTKGEKLWFTRRYAPVEISNHSFLRLEVLKETFDIYSVGATMFQLLTNEFPPNAFDLQDADILKSFGYSLELVRIVNKAMCPNYQNRYQNASDFMEDLEALPILNPYPLYKPLSQETIEKRKRQYATTQIIPQ